MQDRPELSTTMALSRSRRVELTPREQRWALEFASEGVRLVRSQRVAPASAAAAPPGEDKR